MIKSVRSFVFYEKILFKLEYKTKGLNISYYFYKLPLTTRLNKQTRWYIYFF